jgi:hypothetical protein
VGEAHRHRLTPVGEAHPTRALSSQHRPASGGRSPPYTGVIVAAEASVRWAKPTLRGCWKTLAFHSREGIARALTYVRGRFKKTRCQRVRMISSARSAPMSRAASIRKADIDSGRGLTTGGAGRVPQIPVTPAVPMLRPRGSVKVISRSSRRLTRKLMSNFDGFILS